MDETAVVDTLHQETRKWKEKLSDRLENVEPVDDTGQELLQNAEAYRSDAAHFEEDDDPVRAFEAVVWSWAYIDIGVKHGFLTEQ